MPIRNLVAQLSPNDPHRRRLADLVVVLVALSASVAGLFNDFVYDDVPLIVANARVHGFAHLSEIISNAYWPPPFVEQLYRPLTLILLSVEYVAGGGHPFVFHLTSCVLYALSSVLLLRLATRLVSRNTALAVAVLFAAHPVHVEAIALGVNQAEVLNGVLALIMVGYYLRCRRADRVRPRDIAVLALIYAAAALVKESGFVFPLLLVAAELVVVDARGRAERARVLWPTYAALAVVGVLLVIVRDHTLTGGAIAATPAHDLRGLRLPQRVEVLLQVIPTWLRLLVWPLHLRAEYTLIDVSGASPILEQTGGLVLVLLAVAVMRYFRRRDPVVVFGLLWTAVTLAPVSNLVPTGVIVAERTLFVPSMGFLIAAAGVARYVVWAVAADRPRTKRLLATACAVVALLGVVRSVSRELVWNSAHLRIVQRARPNDADAAH